MKETHTNADESNSIGVVQSVCDGDLEQRRSSIIALEQLMKLEQQVEITPIHRFSGGIYSREITIPKGTLLTGRIHKFDHFDIMLSGDVTVSTDNGEVKRLKGLNILEGKAGKKRAGYAHEDTHWITFHSAEERDPEEMYELLTCESFEELEGFYKALNQQDYNLMIQEMGITEEQIQEQVQNEEDMIDMPSDFGFVYVGDSKIHEKGIFSNCDHTADQVICPARISNKITIAGRFTNHAFIANAKMVVTANGVDLIAVKNIPKGEEITVNYRNVFNERQSKGDISQSLEKKL